MSANIAVVPAIPTASVSTAAAVKPRARANPRQAELRSCKQWSTIIGDLAVRSVTYQQRLKPAFRLKAEATMANTLVASG
jgi:transcriptional regulator of nitric oxide reductase